jgi:Tol biopolymer transport system component
VENDGDEYSLWVKQVGTDGKTQVVPRQPLALAHLSFSPDGEYLYFARRSPDSAMFILSRVPAIGGLETPVLDDVDSPVSFSPDGREFVFQRGAGPESHIIVAAAGGGTQRILARQKFPVAPDGQEVVGGVSACGDGRYVVFSALPGRNIWRVTPNAGGAVKLTSGFNDFNPACSHDGKWVLYASREPDHVSLWRVSIEGGTPTPLDLTDSFDVLPSPSGRMIHYTTDALEERSVRDRSTTRSGAPLRQNRWVVISSSDQKRLFAVDATGDGTIGVMTKWAPDETGLDYVVTRNGVSNIWRQPLTGGPPVQITRFSAGKIFSFAWSPDGRWLSLGSGANRSDVVLMSRQP